MTKEKRLKYQQAHVELYEIIQNLSRNEKAKIPKEFIDNLEKNMDPNYSFTFDKSKGTLEQELMTETQALLVVAYEKYLAPESEKELWENYNRICLSKTEQKKREQYNPDNIFKSLSQEQKLEEEVNQKNEKSNTEMVKYKESIFIKIVNKIKRIFRK